MSFTGSFQSEALFSQPSFSWLHLNKHSALRWGLPMRHFGLKAVSYLQRQNKCHYASCFTRLQNAKEGKSGYSWLHLQLVRPAKLFPWTGMWGRSAMTPYLWKLPFWRPSMLNTSSHHNLSLQVSIQQELLLKQRGQKARSSGSTLHREQEYRADLVKGWAAGQSSGGQARGHMAVAGLSIVGACKQNWVQSHPQNRDLLVLGLLIASLKTSSFGLSLRRNWVPF